MRIMVVGPGAIGSLFAAHLHQAGQDVVLLDHNADRATRIASQGIHVTTEDRTECFHVPVLCCSSPEFITSTVAPEVVLICVKAYDTLQAAREVAACCDSQSIVISLQNGIGNDAQLIQCFPHGSILCGSTGMGSTRLENGTIRLAGQGPTAIAPRDGQWTHRKRAAVNALQNAGFEVVCHDDAVSLVWSKAVLNAAINPVTVLYNIQNGSILTRSDAHNTMCTIARESQCVAEQAGITLHYTNAITMVEYVCAQTEKNISSMLQDYRAGRRTEIQNINGEIVRTANKHGISAPINTNLIERMLALGVSQ